MTKNLPFIFLGILISFIFGIMLSHGQEVIDPIILDQQTQQKVSSTDELAIKEKNFKPDYIDELNARLDTIISNEQKILNSCK